MTTIEELESKVKKVEEELKKVRSEIVKWKIRERDLYEKKDYLLKDISRIKAASITRKDWSATNYDWNDDVQRTLKDVFKIDSFRPMQFNTINCTLSGQDVIVIMPTGAGKSLCYQLPALVKPGFTLVISPLLSLMEDQVKSLTDKNVSAMLMSSSNTREETNAALNILKDENSQIKLLYVTPERLAKSKRFMATLQKCYENGRLQRIAIDEVHCCSQWGHDFRPDYKFLGILKNTFKNVPILGLTATASSHVVIDAQKILDIAGCIVIRTTFNRPNLFYQILEKPTSQKECVDILESLLKYRYQGKSGIIYTFSVKDSEEIAKELRNRGIKVGCYHANLEASTRSNVHTKWYEGYYQAIVATVAFGMGIDKPDVRFVIHHTISKSMENYYQESGRAGRDGLRAECVTLYRMQDIFKISALVFSSVNSKEHLYGMIKYCINGKKCRRQIIATYFDETWGKEDCEKMCDVCNNEGTITTRELNLEEHCRTLASILQEAIKQQIKLTAQKLLDAWYLKGPVNLRHKGSEPEISRNLGEDVIVYLLIEGYLEEDYHFTEYNTVVYLKEGPNMHLADDPNFKLKMPIRKYFKEKFDIKTSAPEDTFGDNVEDSNPDGEPSSKKPRTEDKAVNLP